MTNPLPKNRRKLGSVQESCVKNRAQSRPPRITGLERKSSSKNWRVSISRVEFESEDDRC